MKDKYYWVKDDHEMRRFVETPLGHPHKKLPLYKLKAEEQIGRYLKPGEIVHHDYNIDGSFVLVVCKNVAEHSKLDAVNQKKMDKERTKWIIKEGKYD